VSQSVESDPASVGRISAIPAILEVICQTTGMGFAAVARVTEDRWIACSTLDRIGFGLKAGGELPIKTTLCDEVREFRREIVIDDVRNDATYAAHHTPQMYGLQSYISVPITLGDGSFFGTLCAIDPQPARLKETAVVPMFRLFAELIGRHIDDQRLLHRSQAELAESLETAQLREQFIAVLGHDLRNPLAALQGGAHMLRREALSPKGQLIVDHMEKSTRRMDKLVEDMLDLARGRLGGGISIDAREQHSLTATLDQILGEARAAHPARSIEVVYEIEQFVSADLARLGQLFSNLLGNAVAYGSADQPIRVRAATGSGHFELSIANGGDPIPPDALSRLFQPFHRGSQKDANGGLGLGLYIASQIAQAHQGHLDATSDDQETRFTFRMPIASISAS